ncbi:MAG: hypothetical protein COA50_11735 [Flavobacteriaceae bacterium]|nr:MAG: hypothetical protein COA50_11735 [Flavobacteriaceae bacterium]
MKTFNRKQNKKTSISSLIPYCISVIFLFLNAISATAQINFKRHAHVQNHIAIDTSRIIMASTPTDPSKIALIIGNSNYVGKNELKAPANNADVISKKMTELGFTVTLLKNATRIEMQRAIINLGLKSKKNYTVFVYFSGHTVKFDGNNYMIPIDAVLETKDQIKNETLSIDYLISTLNRGAKNRISIDSCYSNSFSIGQENLESELCFTPPSNIPKDIFISFSAFKNQLAPTISANKTSLFSYVFSFNLQQRLVHESFLETKKLVKKFSSGKQDIYFYGTLPETEYWGTHMSITSLLTVQGYQKFSWPPPYTSAMEKVNISFFENIETLGGVNEKLLSSLDHLGYYETSHYPIQEGEAQGFAIATQMEQINKDATSLEGDDRWNSALISDTSDFSFSQYFKSLFMPRKGFFRVIVFAVVNRSFSTSGNTTRDEVLTWANGGQSDLDNTISAINFEGFNVFALIYEYRLHENDITAKIQRPCGHPGRLHLEKSGIWAQLANTN